MQPNGTFLLLLLLLQAMNSSADLQAGILTLQSQFQQALPQDLQNWGVLYRKSIGFT